MPSRPSTSAEGIRLNRFLASCGLGSRRNCEDLVTKGRIEVNGKICLNLATRVMPDDSLRFDGTMLQQARETTLLLNKPKGYLCSRGDPQGRDTIYNFCRRPFIICPILDVSIWTATASFC